MKKIDDKILGAVKVKQPVSHVLKNETVNYILVQKNHRDRRGHREKLHRSVLSVYSVVKKTMQFLISGKIKKSQILGSENQNPRLSVQSAASAFHFRFNDYFINPNNHAQNPANSISYCHQCISIYEIIPQQIIELLSRQLTEEYGAGLSTKQIRHCLRFAETFQDFKILVSMIRQLSWTHFIESKNLIESRCDNE